MEEAVNAISLSDENEYFVKFKKEGFKSRKVNHYFDKQEGEYDPTEFLFTCYMTRKYFKDCLLISFYKFLFGVAAIVLLILLDAVFPIRRSVKSILMVICLGYALFMIPLSILYMIANFWCYLDYMSYVSTRTSVMAKRIIHFYNPETDQFVSVNWGSVFSRDRANYRENKRMRGW